MHKSIHSSAVSISPKPETTQMAVDGRMNKLWDSLRMQNNSAVKMCELAVWGVSGPQKVPRSIFLFIWGSKTDQNQ